MSECEHHETSYGTAESTYSADYITVELCENCGEFLQITTFNPRTEETERWRKEADKHYANTLGAKSSRCSSLNECRSVPTVAHPKTGGEK